MLAASELHGDFVLSSGRRSEIYFDKFRFLTDPMLLDDLAEEVSGKIPAGVDRVGAPEGAAMLLVSAVALKTGLPITVVRKEPKPYGTMSQIEGDPVEGSKIALIEDVATTGHQVQSAARALEEAGATIQVIILAIDRGGGEHLREEGYSVVTVAAVESD